jgi:plastocyanin
MGGQAMSRGYTPEATQKQSAGAAQENSGGGSIQTTRVPTLDSLLTAAGVPNDHGWVRWPLGLRILPGSDDLREQIDGLFQRVTTQSASGPTKARQLDRAVKRLQRLLAIDRHDRFAMPMALYDEGEQFLGRLDRAVQFLEPGVNAPEKSSSPVGIWSASPYVKAPAEDSSSVDVGAYDNYFQPATLTVQTGTTVRWTNHGRHEHTVTADGGYWAFKQLPREGSFEHTFTAPGTYPYYCAIHSYEMRGTVIVK